MNMNETTQFNNVAIEPTEAADITVTFLDEGIVMYVEDEIVIIL